MPIRRLLAFFVLGLALFSCGVERRADQAEEALRAGDLVAAESGYRWVLEREGDHLDALYGLGWVYQLDGDPERAREYFKRCIHVAPDDYRGYKGLGSVAMVRGHLDRAEEYLQQALNKAPDEPTVLNSLALVRTSSEHCSEAMGLLEKAIEIDPTRGEYRLNLAECLHRLDRHDEALSAVDEALSLSIEEIRFRGLLLELRARILVVMTAGRLDPERCAETLPPVMAWLDAAERALEQALALDVELPTIHGVRRRVLRQRSRAAETCSPGTLEDR